MSSKKELSDKVEELFLLKEGEFDPELHLSLAEHIVDKLGTERTYLIRFADLLRFKSKKVQIEHESEGAGEYEVRHIGRLLGSVYLGFHPKLEISHWKSGVMGRFWDETEKLDIRYKGKRVIGIMRYTEIPKVLISGRLELAYVGMKKHWYYMA